MVISNISRIGGRFKYAMVVGAILALSACASARKKNGQAAEMGPFPPVTTSNVAAPNAREVYGPFPDADGVSAGRAAAEIVTNPDQIVLVLGRGLTHGYAYVGVLRALRELKVPIHSIYATEVGALASALYYTQANPNRIDWALLRFTEKNLGAKSGKFSFSLNSPAKDLDVKLQEVFGEQRVESFADRLHISLADAKTGEAIDARSGELWRAVRGALSGANQFDPIDLEGRTVRASARKLSEDYRRARQTEKYPVVVVSVGDPPGELFRKLIEEEENATLIYVPLSGIDDLDLKKRNQAVFSGKNAVHRAAKEILGLVGRKPE